MKPGVIILAAVCLVIAGLTTVFAGPAVSNTVSNFFIVVVLVVGLGVHVGNSGIVSFGHPAFMAIAAYLTAILVLPVARKKALMPNLPDILGDISLNPVVAVIITLIFLALIGGLIGLAISRLNGASATIATLGLLIITHSLLVGGTTFTRGAQAVYGVPKVVTPLIAAGAAIAAIILADWFKYSRWGLVARAAREDEAAAAASGISVQRSRALVFTISIALTALGGSLFALHLGVFSPKEFYFNLTFSLLAMLIVGGGTSTTGAVTGVAIITLLSEGLRRIEPGFDIGGVTVPALFGLTTIGTSLALICTLYLRPEGLMGLKELDDYLPWVRPLRGYKRKSLSQAAQSGQKHLPLLEVRGITKRYGGVTALQDVSLALNPNEILGLIGPNGSGKSTFLSCASGIQAFDEGTVQVNGIAMRQSDPTAFAHSGVGRTFQNIRLFSRLSVYENVAAALVAVPGAADSPSIAQILNRVNLAGMDDRIAETLSYGQQRRLEIARALATCPNFLLLDEPAAGMNSTETAELAEIICSLRDVDGLGILLIDHDLPMILRLSNRVAVLNEGHLIAVGSSAEIRENPKVAAAYFGERSADQNLEAYTAT